jgi:ERCC4-type nuclease
LIKQVITKDKKQSIIEKIKETDKDLKEVMIKILEEYPQIIAKLEKLL